ncbi:RapZ C-terminal domain-containing protein [Streptomyces calvus]|uniref:RapZ C-terminal domain-containing protein n=1 Tax=Streptomyces calvus TaxID=67282 RepID=UPI00114E9A57|nr:RNase adapter RapZ [Streptomyces calvus]
MAAAVEIVSFGYLHDEPPAAHLPIDLREHFRDPHVSPELRYMPAHDEPVRPAVLSPPGVAALALATAAAAEAYASGPSWGLIRIADGCAAGRHRAPVFALALAELLRDAGHQATVHHRYLDKDVVQR